MIYIYIYITNYIHISLCIHTCTFSSCSTQTYITCYMQVMWCYGRNMYIVWIMFDTYFGFCTIQKDLIQQCLIHPNETCKPERSASLWVAHFFVAWNCLPSGDAEVTECQLFVLQKAIKYGHGSRPIVPYLGGWTSIYHLFWCSQMGTLILSHGHIILRHSKTMMSSIFTLVMVLT